MTQNSIHTGLALLTMAVAFLGCHDLKDPEQERIDRAVAAIEAAAPKAARDPTRPIYHYRPPALWMNDVCGAFHYRDYYHLFFQQGPLSDGHNRGRGIGWGHARSRDLVHWEHLRPVLMPPEGARLEASGSAFIRKDGSPILFFAHTPHGSLQEQARTVGGRAGRRGPHGLAPLRHRPGGGQERHSRGHPGELGRHVRVSGGETASSPPSRRPMG